MPFKSIYKDPDFPNRQRILRSLVGVFLRLVFVIRLRLFRLFARSVTHVEFLRHLFESLNELRGGASFF